MLPVAVVPELLAYNLRRLVRLGSLVPQQFLVCWLSFRIIARRVVRNVVGSVTPATAGKIS